MTAQIKVRVQRKAVVKFKVLPRFSSSLDLTAGPGITTVENAVGDWTISIDAATLALINSAVSSLLSEPVIVTTGAASIVAGTRAVAVQRNAPATTVLALPDIGAHITAVGRVPIYIFDWSTSVTDHTITITPDGVAKIMRAASWPISSNSVQLSSIALYPSTLLTGWYTAP